jgi:hypothetical protein
MCAATADPLNTCDGACSCLHHMHPHAAATLPALHLLRLLYIGRLLLMQPSKHPSIRPHLLQPRNTIVSVGAVQVAAVSCGAQTVSTLTQMWPTCPSARPPLAPAHPHPQWSWFPAPAPRHLQWLLSQAPARHHLQLLWSQAPAHHPLPQCPLQWARPPSRHPAPSGGLFLPA